MGERNKQMNFRVSEREYDLIRMKMQLAGIKKPGAYLRKMAIDGYIVRLDLSDIKELLKLAHIDSKNLNQMAKHVNENGSIYVGDIAELKKGQKEILDKLCAVYEKLISIK